MILLKTQKYYPLINGLIDLSTFPFKKNLIAWSSFLRKKKLHPNMKNIRVLFKPADNNRIFKNFIIIGIILLIFIISLFTAMYFEKQKKILEFLPTSLSNKTLDKIYQKMRQITLSFFISLPFLIFFTSIFVFKYRKISKFYEELKLINIINDFCINFPLEKKSLQIAEFLMNSFYLQTGNIDFVNLDSFIDFIESLENNTTLLKKYNKLFDCEFSDNEILMNPLVNSILNANLQGIRHSTEDF